MFSLKNQIIYSIIFTVMWRVISHLMNAGPTSTYNDTSSTETGQTQSDISNFLHDMQDIIPE